MRRLLEEVSFRHPDRARADVERVGEGVAPRTLAVVENLLASVPDPDEALHCLERFRQANPAAFDRISASPAALRHLITTFAYSRFLAEAVSKNPEWLLATTESGLLHRTRSAEEYEADLVAHLGGDATSVPSAAALARFRRQQLLRILLRDVLGLASLADVTGELSNLADAILDVAYRRIREALARRHGDAAGCGFAVLALGKLGGKELNYSSDIDLMFVYSANGQTAGREPVSYKEFFKKLANSYTELLSTYTADGLCYRVDLRLRPDGKNGEVCISLEGARSYYATRARDWELQMLIKARISAGDRAPGQELLDSVEPRIYSSTLDFRALEAVSETRERINEKLARRRGAQAGLDIKLAPGGIRDIEFLVQCLQRLHGGRERWLRHGGTQLALERLRDKLLLSGPEHSRLLTAYQFLRNLEHRLQFYDDRQTHTLPEDLEELDVLARKMPLGLAGGLPSADSLKRELDAHLAHVRELYDRVIHANNPLYYGAPVEGHPESHPEGAPGGIPEGAAPAGGNALPGTAPPADRPAVAASNLTRYLDQRAPRLAAQLARAPLGRGAARAGRLEHFLEKMLAAPELLARLDFEPPLVD
ncbi:MAG: glutamine-synthetase adenylyltransferase, partial [Acidobacteria bacterium]|nr:glutamine-synthetase adenylyltransferase [Acidobacteriota bacterium]